MASPDQAQQPTKTDAPESNAEQGKSRTGWYLGGGVAVAALATMFFSINRSSSVQPSEGSEKSPLVDKSRDLQTELAAKCGDLLGKFEPSKELAPLLTKGEVKLTLWNPESIGMQDKTFQRGALNFGNEVRIDSRLVEALQKGLAAGGASPEQSRELTAMLILPDVTAGVAHFKSTRELESLIGKPLGGTPLEQEFVNELIAARTFDALKVSLTPEQAEILRKAVAASPEVENHWNESVRRSDALTHSPQAVFGYTKQAHPDAKSITSLTPDPEGAKKVIQQLMDKNKAEINQPTEAAPIEKPTGLTAEDRAKVARQIAEYQANIRKQMRVENETARVENQIANNNILSPERAVRWNQLCEAVEKSLQQATIEVSHAELYRSDAYVSFAQIMLDAKSKGPVQLPPELEQRVKKCATEVSEILKDQLLKIKENKMDECKVFEGRLECFEYCRSLMGKPASDYKDMYLHLAKCADTYAEGATELLQRYSNRPEAATLKQRIELSSHRAEELRKLAGS